MNDLSKKLENLNIKRDFIRSECKEMCPLSEYEFRIKNRMVHSLEKMIILK
jgi:hypothetical protein